jgi:hypothetical protein
LRFGLVTADFHGEEPPMSVQVGPCTVVFPDYFDARAEYEAPLKGYLRDVEVRLEDGSRFLLCFVDPVRLQQTLEDDVASGRPYYTEPGLVVLPEVTTEAIRKAVPGLLADGFFQHLKPVA